MASDDSTHEKTEQPTGRRREQARREGRIAQSRDLTGAVALLAALGVQALTGGQAFGDAVRALASALGRMGAGELTPTGAVSLLSETVVVGLGVAWPLVAVPAAVAVAVQLAQTRFAFAPSALQPRWHRLNPLATLGQMLGGHGAVELVKSLLKLAIVGGVAWTTLAAEWPRLTGGAAGAAPAFSVVAEVVGRLWLRVGLAYLALAALDYGWQWWRQEQSLRMSREELRQESKETEGDPMLRSRMRAIGRQLTQKRMLTEVKRADVVVRNPTHFAVALRYESGRMHAPRVVAKGERLQALRIIDVARRAGVPIVENPPLARALHAAVAVGREIPQELYRAVAEVLAYVYALRGGRR